jgi:hypothetical protein
MYTILNLGTRWRWVVSVTLRVLYPQAKNPRNLFIGGWVCPRAGLDTLKKRKKISFLLLLGIKPRLLGCPARLQYLGSSEVDDLAVTVSEVQSRDTKQ